MRVLAIESSSPHNSIALCENGNLVALESFASPRRQSGPLFSLTNQLIQQTGTPDRIVVGTGPGSYSGIRTAIALGQGLSMALQIPLLGISSLLGINISSTRFGVFGNARSNQAWIAEIDQRKFSTSPHVIEQKDLPAWLAIFEHPIFRVGPFANYDHISAAIPCASHLATLGALLDPATQPPEPLYLKEAHITSQKAIR